MPSLGVPRSLVGCLASGRFDVRALPGGSRNVSKARAGAELSYKLPVPVGELVAGKYRVEGVLGRGGMGVVVAATDCELERRVAIKFVERNDEQATARFLNEARAAAR